MSESLERSERETIITATDDDTLVHIWSAQRRHITRMRGNSAFTEVDSGFYGKTEWASFTVPADRWSPAGVKRQVSLTKQQRNDAAARLSALRGEE